MSHCVNYTLRDIVEHWPEEERGKITLLKDCSSSVPGFDSASDIFIGDMIEAGVNVETSDSVRL
jgi:nicotinamidase-related amidase